MAIPTIPAPPANLIAPQGQTSPATPQWTSFLPSGGGVATGLTPQMLAGINRPMGPAPAPGGAAAGPQSSYQQLLNFFGGMGGWGGQGGGNAGMPGMGGGMGSWPTIPAPTAGAGGLVNAGDLSAYTSAKKQQDAARSALARQMSRRDMQQRQQQQRGLVGRGSDRDSGR